MNIPSSNARRGSAIVIVLGMLSVLMLMSIAFTTFMRTEHAGSTNLKNGLVAHQALSTAIARATDAIDLSIDIPTGGDPFPAVPVWPEPWLSSSSVATNDFLQSAALTPTERPGAQLLTYEMSRYLTPAQIEMVRSAKVDWAPIHASVGTDSLIDRRPTGVNLYGNLGRPGGDSVIGRYAFVALPTTGLLDLNLAGTPENRQNIADRAETDGSDTSAFFLPTGDANFKYTDYAENDSEREVSPKRMVSDPNKFFSARRRLGAFSSFLDARLELESKWSRSLWLGGHAEASQSGLDLKWPGNKESASSAKRWTTGSPDDDSFFPADTFVGYSTALDGLDPEGRPRVHLPTKEEFEGFSRDELTVFANRSLAAMVKVFARSRMANPDGSSDAPANKEFWKESSNDELTFFFQKKSSLMRVSRARLATVAMLDAMDEDLVPGENSKTGVNYWNILGRVATTLVDSEGSTGEVVDERPSSSNPLDFPCTEPVPQLSQAWAFVTWESCVTNYYCSGRSPRVFQELPPYSEWRNWTPDNPNAGNRFAATIGRNGDFGKWRVVWRGKIHVGALAALQNAAPGWEESLSSKSYSMQLDWKVLTGWPSANSVAASSGASRDFGDIFCDGSYVFWGREATTGNNDPAEVLDDFVGREAPAVHGPFTTRAGDLKLDSNGSDPRKLWFGARTYSEGESNASKGAGAESLDFVVVCYPNQQTEFPHLVPKTETTPSYWTQGNIQFDPPVVCEANSKSINDAYLPVALKVTIRDSSGKVVQQVPAPTLDDDAGTYWLRLDAGAWHRTGNDSESAFKGTKSPVSSLVLNGKSGRARDDARASLAWGWAMCAAPQFAFDTTGLVTDRADGGGFQRQIPGRMNTWLSNRILMPDSYLRDDKSFDWSESLVTEIDGNPLDDLEFPNSMVPLNTFQSSYLAGHNGVDFSFWRKWVFGGQSPAPAPDFAHYWKNPPQNGADNDSTDGLTFDRAAKFLSWYPRTRIRNGEAFRNPGDLGSVMCGPCETLSLFRTYRPQPGSGTARYRADFHRVFDYFTAAPDARYPSVADIKPNDLDNGELKVNAFGNKNGSGSARMQDKLFYAGVFTNGVVNLNVPWLVHLEGRTADPPRASQWVFGDDGRTYYGLKRKVPNLYPLMSAITGARISAPKYSTGSETTLAERDAANIASAIFRGIEDGGTRFSSRRFGMPANEDNAYDSGWPQVRSVSDALGALPGDREAPNGLLETIMGLPDMAVDADREALLGNIGGAFATRGQSFLLLVRADAYTPKFGEEESTSDGNSLASTHALVELWRDPEPARTPYGTLPRDQAGNPYLFHDWQIRSIRVF